MVPGLRVLARARALYGEDAPLIFVAVRFDAACQKRVCRVARNAEIRRESNGQAGKRSCPMAWYYRLSRTAEFFGLLSGPRRVFGPKLIGHVCGDADPTCVVAGGHGRPTSIPEQIQNHARQPLDQERA